jgi:hypothetical protein
MSNVKSSTRTKKPRVSRVMRADIDRMRAALPPLQTPRGILAVAWLIVRVPLFLVLYWLRLPVMLVCNLISIPALAAFFFAWYAFPERTNMVIAFAVVSFGAFAVLWIYDFVLMALSPEDTVRML